MAEPTTDPRAAQIEAVRDVLGSSTNRADGTDNDLNHLAAQLVDAVHAAGDLTVQQHEADAATLDQLAAGGDGQGERVTPTERRGFGRRNPHCSNCGDERGGPFGHEISECQYRDGMSVEALTKLPHLAGREPEVWGHYVDRYFEHEPIRREGEARGYARAVATLRDDDGFRAWQDAHPDAAYASRAVRKTLADYLQAVGPT